MRIHLREDSRNDAHVEVSVFIGAEGQGGHAGQLTLRADEYSEFRRRIEHFGPVILAARRMAVEAGRRIQAPPEYWHAIDAFWAAIAAAEKDAGGSEPQRRRR
jgi:hypothetical protein